MLLVGVPKFVADVAILKTVLAAIGGSRAEHGGWDSQSDGQRSNQSQ